MKTQTLNSTLVLRDANQTQTESLVHLEDIEAYARRYLMPIEVITQQMQCFFIAVNAEGQALNVFKAGSGGKATCVLDIASAVRAMRISDPDVVLVVSNRTTESLPLNKADEDLLSLISRHVMKIPGCYQMRSVVLTPGGMEETYFTKASTAGTDTQLRAEQLRRVFRKGDEYLSYQQLFSALKLIGPSSGHLVRRGIKRSVNDGILNYSSGKYYIADEEHLPSRPQAASDRALVS